MNLLVMHMKGREGEGTTYTSFDPDRPADVRLLRVSKGKGRSVNQITEDWINRSFADSLDK